MENYEDIDATFNDSTQIKENSYQPTTKRIYTHIGGNTSRIDPKSPLYFFGLKEVIDMVNDRGKFVYEWELNGGSYEEEIARELKNLPSIYETLKQKCKGIGNFTKGLAKVLISGKDEDALEFLKKYF